MAEEFLDTVTKLSPEEEVNFDIWAGKMRSEGVIGPYDQFSDYDMRGYWKETGGKEKLKAGDHFPDKWKRPNHPTFSDESIYSQGEFSEKYGDMAGHWDDNEFVAPVSAEELYNTYNNDEEKEFDTLRQKESLEAKFGVKIDYNPQGIDQKTERIANNKDMSPSFVDTMNDCAYSFFKGLYNFGVAIQEAGGWVGGKIAEMQVGKDIDFDPSRDMKDVGLNNVFMPEPTTKAGQITEGVTQVAAGIYAGKLLKVPGLAKTEYGSGLVNALASCFGMFSLETMAFSANEENFAEILKMFGLPTIEKLVKNPDDTFWQKKIKNGVSAGVAGLVIDGIYKAAKMFYNAGVQAIKNRKVYEPILEYSLPAQEKIIDAEFTIVNPKEIPMTAKEVQKAVSEGKMIRPREEETAIKSIHGIENVTKAKKGAK